MSDTRRSNRSRKSNARYTLDPLEGVEFEDDPKEGRQPEPRPADDDSADDFDASKEIAPQDEDVADDHFSDDGNANIVGSHRDVNFMSAYGDADDASSQEDMYEEYDLNLIKAPKEITIEDRRRKPAKEEGTRIRMLLEFHKGSQERRLHSFYGRDPDDFKPAAATRNLSYPFPTLPTRHVKGGQGGLAFSLFYSEKTRRLEGTTGWNWYYDQGGRDFFQQRQHTKSITPDEALPYLIKPAHKSINLLLGPFPSPKLYNLKARKSMRLHEPWPDKETSDTTYKNGWLLNLGRRIQTLDWAPNRSEGTQYLGVSMLRQQIARPPRGENKTSAFRPAELQKDTFEIWAFDVPKTAPGASRVNSKPRLALSICTEWGYLKDFKWCPCLKHRSRKSQDDPGVVNLGLLAGIWSDGALRVLDLQCAKDSTQTQYLHLSEVAFEARIPRTVLTCLTWLSSKVIATGGADGTVSIWDLSKSMNTKQAPRPIFYELIHETYISAISSAYPTHPHLVTTSSMDGFFHLFDIRSPRLDKASPPRSRVGSPTAVWSDHCQGWLSPDDHCIVKLFSVRRVFSYVAVGRGDGVVGSLATSPVHLSALMGTHSGHVHATNPERKIFDSRTLAWQITWFLHEYKPAQIEEEEVEGALDRESADEDPTPNVPLSHLKPDSREVRSRPLVRITEGFKPVEIQMNQVEATADGDDFDASYTIHEEQTAVTSVSWNPNMSFGGWAAAGMGSGLVRVEDIAI